MQNNKFITILTGGIKALVTAISTSAGVADANKVVSTDDSGTLNDTLISSEIARVTDITNQQKYGKFTGLLSNYYLLGTDVNIMPVVDGQSGIQAYWGLQLGGIRPAHRYVPGFVAKDPPDIYSIEAPDTFCVGIQAQTSDPNPNFIFSGAGISKPFSVLNLYSTNWHTNGHFLNCKNSSYTSIFNINLEGEIYIKNNKILGARDTGWTVSSGSSNKGTFDTALATIQQCAERIKALEDMLRNHGLIN